MDCQYSVICKRAVIYIKTSSSSLVRLLGKNIYVTPPKLRPLTIVNPSSPVSLAAKTLL
jgi:hypothetical protein